MLKTMPETAQLYLADFPSLDEARKTLIEWLDDLWREVHDTVRESLVKVAQEAGLALQIRENQSQPGKYRIGTADKSMPVSFYARVRDPRHSEAAQCYEVYLHCSKGDLAMLQPAARQFIEERAEEQGLPRPTIGDSNILLRKDIPIEPANLEATVEGLTDAIERCFRLVVQCETWIRDNRAAALKT